MIAIFIDVVVSILTSLISCLVFLKVSKKVNNGKAVKQDEEKATKYSFENYFYDIENKAFINTLLEVVKNCDKKIPLILKGKSGSGKTHLLHAIQEEFIKNNRNVRTVLISAEAFTDEFLNSIKNKTSDLFKQKYRNLDALFIDNLDYLLGKEVVQAELFYTLNSLRFKNAFIAITTSGQKSLKEILDERLYNHFSSGLTIEIPSCGREAKQSKIHSLLLMHGCFLPDSAINYLAEQNLSMPELTGVINKIVILKNQKYIEITIEEIKKILDE